MIETLTEYRTILATFGAALIAALIALVRLRRNATGIITKEFIDSLSADIAALSDPRNISKDAFEILEKRFSIHHDGVIKVLHRCDWLRKYRLNKAWTGYYGEEGEQDWWLPNEYSALFSNQLKNTQENTKQLAIHRLRDLIKRCP